MPRGIHSLACAGLPPELAAATRSPSRLSPPNPPRSLLDTAGSGPAPGAREAAAEDALMQATAWMHHIYHTQRSALP